VELTDLQDQLATNLNNWGAGRDRFVASIEQSFTRTVLALIDEGRPFTEVVTTRRFMMNVPMMSILAYLDAVPVDDKGVQRSSWLTSLFPNMQTQFLTATETGGTPIPIGDSLDPKSPRFMQFTYEQPAGKICQTQNAAGVRNLERLVGVLFGEVPQGCKTTTAFTEDDWNTWRMIEVRKPASPAERPVFFDVAKLRTANTLALETPRIGFMTTPAFFGSWATNDSNVFRVTANQMLIVALGRSFEPEGTTIPIDDSNIEGEHSVKGTVCYGCHSTLDPMRDFFRQSYSIFYSQKQGLDASIPAETTFTANNSAPIKGNGIEALATAVASHPDFAKAWALKMCQHANAGACVADDPELGRVAGVFAASRFNFHTLLRTLYASPVVTFAARTRTAESLGVTVSIARRDLLCDRLAHRLGVSDPCSLAPGSTLKARTRLANLALGIPESGFSRGDPHPIQPREPNMFFAAGSEKICVTLADVVVDGAAPFGKWSNKDLPTAMKGFTEDVMGVTPDDPRATAVKDLLGRHRQAALDAGASAIEALRSTFTVACASALGTSVGL
jgi:hypothetical protein